MVGSGGRSSDFGFGILGDSTGFLVVGLFPLPGVSEFEEVGVVETLVGRVHSTKEIDHLTVLIPN